MTTEAATGPNPRSSRAREAQDMEEDHPLRPGERQGQAAEPSLGQEELPLMPSTLENKHLINMILLLEIYILFLRGT